MKKHIFIIIWTVFVFVKGDAQCYPDRHNTNWFDGWISCETAPNPNDAYGDSHWILYDFKESYELGQVHVWNTNDPSNLDYGMQEVSIDYSVDGMEWIHMGNFFFDIGTGKSIYEGFEGPDFEGAVARYVLLTGLSNYGGACYGLSELRFAVQEFTVQTTDPKFLVDCAVTGKGVLLEWTVDGFLDGVEYSIERSLDLANWTLIKTTEKYTLGEGKHTFHYIDNGAIDAPAYYRLISRLEDGRKEISDAHYCLAKSLGARVYPNPMDDHAKLEITSQESSVVLVRIVDVFGRILLEESFVPASLTTSISLDEIGLKEGHYFIMVRQGDTEQNLKLIKF